MIFVASSVPDGTSRADAGGSGGTSSHNGDNTAVENSGGDVVENSDSAGMVMMLAERLITILMVMVLRWVKMVLLMLMVLLGLQLDVEMMFLVPPLM